MLILGWFEKKEFEMLKAAVFVFFLTLRSGSILFLR